MNDPARIAIIDDERYTLRHLRDVLAAEGFQVETAEDGAEGLALVRAARPDLVLLDLVMPDLDGLTVCRQLRADPTLSAMPIIVLTARYEPENVEQAFKAGADDYLRKPVTNDELLTRIRTHLKVRQSVEEVDARRRDAATVLELTGLLSTSSRVESIALAVARRLAGSTSAYRCSVLLPELLADGKGLLAASDEPEVRQLQVTSHSHPEFELLRETQGQPLALTDVRSDSRLASARERLESEESQGLFLFPLQLEQELFGALILSYRRLKPTLTNREHELCQVIAGLTAGALRRIGAAPEPIEDTSPIPRGAEADTAQRLKELERFEAYFESAADAMLTLDEKGTVVTVNREGEKVLSRSRSELTGLRFPEIFAEESQPLAEDLMIGFRQGEFPRYLDMFVRRRDELCVLLVTTSALSGTHGNAMVSIRDVTGSRETEEELRRTKEFLENLIDGSVEGIVAWDVEGGVLLFNTGAEEITRREAEDVIGVMAYDELFPGTMAEEIMSQLRAERFGGIGRLESMRKAILGRDGETIPVNLTASIVYEDGEEAATVAVFSDLRDRLAMEKKLSAAQERLVQSEKQAVVAELAGTAAHELNQPLTSVMGYAELLLRKTPEGNPNRRAVEIIFREAERMAGIVRKIGKITRYETTTYVGSTKIVDLDKSTEEDDS